MAATLSQLFVGLFNAATGGYSKQFTTSNANDLANVVSIVAGQDLSTDTAYINYVLGNLGVTSSSAVYSAAFTAMQGLVTAQGRGNAVLVAANFLQEQSTVSTSPYYAVATAFVAKVATADAFTAAHSNEVNVASLTGALTTNGLGFSTSTDTLQGSSANDVFSALAASTGNTYDDGDLLVDASATDKDVFTLSTSIDVTAVPTIQNIETVNVNVDAITTTDTDFAFAATNIGQKTTFNFDNVAAVTAINSLTVTGLGASQTVNASADFPTVSLNAGTNSVTASLASAGTVGTPAALTIAAASKNVTATGAGYLNVSATTATGAINATAAKNLTITATAAAAVLATSTGGSVTLTDVDSASLVNVTATGNITGAAAALKAVKTLNLNSGGTVTATLATLSTLTSATLAGKGTTNSFTDTDGTLVEVSLSGNGGAATFDLPKGTTSVLNTVNVSGSQDVTVKLDASAIDALTTTTGYEGAADTLAVIDASTGVSKVKLQTAAGNADLSKSVGLDKVELAVSNAAKTLTMPLAAELKISADQAAVTTIAQAAATKTTNAIAIVMDDGARDGAVADFVAGSLVMTGIKTATIDASIDTTAAGASNAHGFKVITGTDANTDVTINAGLNALNLAAVADGAINLGTGKLTVNGTGAVTVTMVDGADTGTMTVSEFDASGKTAGVVTAAALSLATTPIFKSGAGADVITIAAVQTAAASISTDGGNDTITLAAGDHGAQNLTIDMGDGATDKLILLDGVDIDPSTGKSITLSGIEIIELKVPDAGTDDVVAASIGSALLDGKTFTIQGDTTANASTVAVGLTTDDTTVDLSTLVETTETAKTVAATTWTMDAAAKTAGFTLTGMSGAKNVLKGAVGYQNTLVGGSKVDAFTAGNEDDTITAGAGIDTYDLTSATGGTSTKFVTITDFAVNATAAGGGETLQLPGTAVVFAGSTGTWTLADGFVTKTGGTLDQFITNAVEWIGTAEAAVADSGDLQTLAFVYGGSTYVYFSGADGSISTDDIVVKLTGINATVMEASAATAGAILIG